MPPTCTARAAARLRIEAFAQQERAEEHSTASYRAPELFDVKVDVPIDEKADVWSLALILYYMAFGQSAFENEQEGVMTLAIRGGKVTFPEELIMHAAGEPAAATSAATSSKRAVPAAIHPSRLFSSDFVGFLRELLTADPAARLTLRDSMKKTVILMMAALERHQAREAAAKNAPATASAQGEDDFGDFESGAAVLATLTPAALDLLVTDMQLGSAGLLKFGRQGNPHPTRLHLAPTKDALTYTSKGGKPNVIPLSRVFSLTLGQVTRKFARFKALPAATSPYKPHLCFSLLLRPAAAGEKHPDEEPADPAASGEETLDLQADSHQTFRTWTIGIQALLAQPEIARRENVGI